jgi:hypothetical protein
VAEAVRLELPLVKSRQQVVLAVAELEMEQAAQVQRETHLQQHHLKEIMAAMAAQ